MLGRDFVVGDIHGCFGQPSQVLQEVDSATQTDCPLYVGDRIDRGPQSTDTLRWFAEPWSYACLGNHEVMALEALLRLLGEPSSLAGGCLTLLQLLRSLLGRERSVSARSQTFLAEYLSKIVR